MNKLRLIYTQNIQHFLQTASKYSGAMLCKPSFFSARVTYRCNLRCKHCSAWKTKAKGELSTKEWKNIISEIRDWTKGAYISFGGGEPLLRKDIFELIDYASDSGLYTMIISNGYTNKSLAKRLAESKIDLIKISMDGYGKVHDSLRGVNGTCKKIKDIITILSCNNKKVLISTILNKESQKSLDPMFKFVNQNNNIIGIEFQPILPDLFAKNSVYLYKKSELWPRNTKRICRSIDKIIQFKKEGGPVLNSTKHLQLMKQYFKNPNQKIIHGDCNALYQKIRISPKGDIEMCNKYFIGNIKHNGLKDLWNNRRINKLRKKLKNCKENCLLFNCNYRDSVLNRFNKFRIIFKKRQ